MKRAMVVRGISLLFIGVTWLAGCDDGEDGSFSIDGIWNADVQYKTYDGQPDNYQGAMTFRFDPADGGWSCVVSGIPASSCVFDPGDPESFRTEATVTANYPDYSRTRTYRFEGVSSPDSKTLLTDFVIDTLYSYSDGSQSGYSRTGVASLVRVDRADSEPTSGLRLLGEYGFATLIPFRGGPAHETEPGQVAGHDEALTGIEASANVRVKGDYAYLARFSDGLRVLDVSDPANIREVAHVSVSESGGRYFNDVKLFSTDGRDYAALSDNSVGLVVYDVTDPAAPFFVSSYFPDLSGVEGDHLNNHTVFIEGTIAYMGNYGGSDWLDPEGSGGLLIVDLSNPAEPKELGRWLARELNGSFVHDLYVEGGIAYLCTWEEGLVMLDVRNPAVPQVLGRFTYDRMTSHSVWVTTIGTRRIAVQGDEDFGSHIRMIDVDPASPEFMQQISEVSIRPEVSVHNIMARGSEVVAAWYQDGIRVIDASDVTAPRVVAWYNTWEGQDDPDNGYSFYEGGIGVDMVDDRIFLVDIHRGLLILERE